MSKPHYVRDPVKDQQQIVSDLSNATKDVRTPAINTPTTKIGSVSIGFCEERKIPLRLYDSAQRQGWRFADIN